MPFLLLLLSNPGLHHSVRRLHHTRSGHPETMWRWRIHSGSYFQRTWTTSGVHNLSVRYVQQSKDQFTLAARFPARGKFEHHCTLSITFQSQSFGFRFRIYFCFIILSFSSSIGQKTKCTIITIPHLTESSDWIENLCISLSLFLSVDVNVSAGLGEVRRPPESHLRQEQTHLRILAARYRSRGPAESPALVSPEHHLSLSLAS